MKIYNLISYILSAPFIAIYVSIIFALFTPFEFVQMNRILAATLGSLFLGIIPLFIIIFLQRIGYTREFDVKEQKPRDLIYLFSIISFIISTIIFYYLGSHVMFLISLAYVCVTSVFATINLFFKISAHVSGVAGPTTALVFVFGLKVLPVYILTLIIAYVRLKMKAHNMFEIISGFVTAVAVTSLVYLMMW